jgi:hypothetical protein
MLLLMMVFAFFMGGTMKTRRDTGHFYTCSEAMDEILVWCARMRRFKLTSFSERAAVGIIGRVCGARASGNGLSEKDLDDAFAKV